MRFLAIFPLFAAAATATLAAPSPSRVARQIDRLIAEDVGLSPGESAPRVGDAAFLRRASLDLIGAIPSPGEVRDFVNDDAADKRTRIVDDLVHRTEFGVAQARYWRDVILSRRLEDRALLVSAALESDLAEWINAGESWSVIAERFITATGSAREDGATAILVAQDGRTEEIAAEVSRVFLGVQIQCAQCHDHPWDSWKREQFHELAAFFPRVGVRPQRGRPIDLVVNVADRRDFPLLRTGANLNRRGRPEHYMQDPERPEEVGARIEPRFFLTGMEAPLGTRDAERRGRLAEELTASEWFSTALVNRYWAELIGEGFYEPVDDLGPGRKPSAPRAAERLATAFTDSGHDLRWLHRTILATDAYQRESRPRRAPGAKPFAANVAQPLRGDQLFDATLAALGVDERRLRGLGGARQGRGYGLATPRLLFNSAFGYDPSEPRDTVQATIPQALARMNTPQLNLAVRALPGAVVGGLSLRHADDASAIARELYLRTLSREPTGEELAVVLDHVDGEGVVASAMEDLFWALLNTAEFSHRR
ncbi:DUF1549 domain-containing protein [Botrimarina sp.]|uniref:DUF1549 domain-containing protein n=1 Tax=Botrimarina sp. TaxID=2795802 RepID=UPI0032EE3641